MREALRDRYLRIDARSLGLFRLAMGVVLLCDLFRRWALLDDFYSNDGVLTNHNHLFNLKDTGRVWSVLHAFSSPSDVTFAFVCFLLVYVFFFLGYKTRVFHILSLVSLVSLSARNVLTDNAGDYAAIALLAFSAFLPLGRRFSLDALFVSMGARHEKDAEDLNDRGGEEPDYGKSAERSEERAPGASPTSIAALALIVQLALIYLCTALQQSGDAWKDGTALHYAIFSERWASGLGISLRSGEPTGLLSALTHLLSIAQWAIPALILFPALRTLTRGAAFVLVVIHALTLGLLLSLGLYAWTLLAAAALILPTELWDRAAASLAKKPKATLIYDSDCGVCLWLARLAKRLDLGGRIVFLGNTSLASEEGREGLPKEVTAELCDQTIVVIDHQKRVFTRARAVSAIIARLPLGWTIAWVLRVPGLAQLFDAFYRFVAPRRFRMSELCGLAACGIPLEEGSGEAPEAPPETPPSAIVRRRFSAFFREIFAVLIFVAMLAQTGKENPLPASMTVPQNDTLAAVALWPRMIGRWDILAPEPGRDNVAFIVDGQNKAGDAIDPLTGEAPELDLAARKRPIGQLWSDFLSRIHQKEWEPFQRAFKDSLAKGRPNWTTTDPETRIIGFDAYWVTQPIPAPGEAPSEVEATKEKVFTHSRGGRFGTKPGTERIPLLPAGALRIPRK